MKSSPPPRISLIVGTVARTREPLRLVESLNLQSRADMELIIVDQNERNRSHAFRNAWEGEDDGLVYLNVPRTGAAHARNVGLARARGRILTFPDDDCWYPPGLVSRVVRFLEDHPGRDGLTCRAVNRRGESVATRWSPSPGPVRKLRVWRQGSECTMFLRASVLESVGGFDESLGVGADSPWGSGEGTDLLLRALADGASIIYRPDLVVHHPGGGREAYADPVGAHSYAMGMGRVLADHEFPVWHVAYQLIRPLGGILLALAQADAERSRYHRSVAVGRLRGWWRSLRG